MVCRAGTLRFQRKGSNEVMSYSIRQCRISPAANVTAQVVKPTRHRAGLDSQGQVLWAPLPTADSNITHTGAVFTWKDGIVFAMWAAQPRPFQVLRVNLSTPRMHLAQICQSPSTDPLHTAAVYHREHIPLAAASRTKRECLCFHQSGEAQVHEKKKRKTVQTNGPWHFSSLDHPRHRSMKKGETQREGH